MTVCETVCEAVNKGENAVYPVCLQEANTHRRSLESEVKTRASAMDAYDQMNSSLVAANISLQVTSVILTSAPCWSLLELHTYTSKPFGLD